MSNYNPLDIRQRPAAPAATAACHGCGAPKPAGTRCRVCGDPR